MTTTINILTTAINILMLSKFIIIPFILNLLIIIVIFKDFLSVFNQIFLLFHLQGKEADADRARQKLSKGSKSDHIMLINAFSVSYLFI